MFDAGNAENEIEAWLEELLGEDKFTHIVWDYYDCSLEIKGCVDGIELSNEALQRLWENGFMRCWVCYADKAEHYYTKDGISHFKQAAKGVES